KLLPHTYDAKHQPPTIASVDTPRCLTEIYIIAIHQQHPAHQKATHYFIIKQSFDQCYMLFGK
ncbi:MAG: hypothetical protein ACRC7W_06155, partial [Fusobacteriaceae bacterium]